MEANILDTLSGAEQHVMLLLDSLSTHQREELKAFSNCPLFCDDPAVKKLLYYMEDPRHKRPKGGFLLQVLYMESYNRKVVEPEKMASLFARAITLIEDYIVTIALKEDRMKRGEYLTRHVAELPETTVFQGALTQWQQAIEEAPETYEKLYQKNRAFQEEWSHWATDRYKKAPRLVSSIIYAHEDYCRTVTRMFELAGEMRANLITDVAPETASASKQNVLFILSNQLVALHKGPADEVAYLDFLDNYDRYFKRLGNAERELILRSLINYCTKQMKDGQTAFIQHLFKLCNWATRQQAFTARWLRSDADFLNLAMAFCRPDALQEMKDFIHLNSKNLPTDIRNEASALALAYYHFFKGEFPISLEYLKKVVSREILYKLRFHSLRIRIHYELGKEEKDFDDLDKALEAYEKYFDRDEWLHDQRRENYIRLAWFVRKMMNAVRSIQTNAKTEAYYHLSKEVQDTDKPTPIAMEWILSEISKWHPNT